MYFVFNLSVLLIQYLANGFEAIKKAKEVLSEYNIDSAFISAISSIETIGLKSDGSKWKIGIQNPDDPQEIIEDIKKGMTSDYLEEVDRKKAIIKALEYSLPENYNEKVVLIAGKGHEEYQEINNNRRKD